MSSVRGRDVLSEARERLFALLHCRRCGRALDDRIATADPSMPPSMTRMDSQAVKAGSLEWALWTGATRLACLGLFATLVGACGEPLETSARARFVGNYACPADQVTVRPVGNDYFQILDVVGCGKEAQYRCAPGRFGTKGTYDFSQGPNSCVPRDRTAYRATDGTVHEGWESPSSRYEGQVPLEVQRAQREAAVSSAAHDIPCDPASTAALDGEMVEGCGQRVTYRTVAEVIPTTPGHFVIKEGYRYTLVGRVAIPGGATPGPGGTPPSDSTLVPSPSPAPTVR